MAPTLRHAGPQVHTQLRNASLRINPPLYSKVKKTQYIQSMPEIMSLSQPESGPHPERGVTEEEHIVLFTS